MNERARRIERRFETPMLIAALLVIPMLVIEEHSTDGLWGVTATALNWGTWLAFATELVVMLSVVDDRREWLRRHPLEVAITVCTTPLVPALAGGRLLRLLRILRLLRLAPLAQRIFSLDGIRYAALLAVMCVLIGGAGFAEVEDGASWWDGIWWAVTTMTTVGYGDMYPETDVGRAIGIALMVGGVALGTLLIGAFAERFIARGAIAQELAEEEVTDAEILRELRELSQRIARIEAALARREGSGVES